MTDEGAAASQAGGCPECADTGYVVVFYARGPRDLQGNFSRSCSLGCPDKRTFPNFTVTVTQEPSAAALKQSLHLCRATPTHDQNETPCVHCYVIARALDAFAAAAVDDVLVRLGDEHGDVVEPAAWAIYKESGMVGPGDDNCWDSRETKIRWLRYARTALNAALAVLKTKP